MQERLLSNITASHIFPYLIEMYFRHNSLISIPPVDAPKARVVNLGCNRLTSLSGDPFRHVPRLRELYLNNNEITGVAASAFGSCYELQVINLEHNRIAFISESAFAKQGHFSLLMGHNDMVKVMQSSLPVLSRTVSLDPNPWRCGCELYPLRLWFQRSGVYALICHSPDALKGDNFMALGEDKFCATQQEANTAVLEHTELTNTAAGTKSGTWNTVSYFGIICVLLDIIYS